jgi:hypothetical protein
MSFSKYASAADMSTTITLSLPAKCNKLATFPRRSRRKIIVDDKQHCSEPVMTVRVYAADFLDNALGLFFIYFTAAVCERRRREEEEEKSAFVTNM